MSAVTIKNYPANSISLSLTDIPSSLLRMAFGQTSQFSVNNGADYYLVHLPFTQGGGPLYFDFLVFGSDKVSALTYKTSIDNELAQGVSGHAHLFSSGAKSVVIADSGKEWLSWVNEAFSGTGYESMSQPPQDYGKWPLGYLIRVDALDSAPYLKVEKLSTSRAYNHSVDSGDVNGDGIADYLVSGTSKQEDELFYTRVGYLLVSKSTGGYQEIWINNPNQNEFGVAKGGLGNVALSDLDSDGRDELIFSGGSTELSGSDKAFLVMRVEADGTLTPKFSLTQYGRFRDYGGYNHYTFDFDSDGDSDIIAYFGVSSFGFEILENTGNGIFSPVTNGLGINDLSIPDFKTIQFLDVNRDGYVDIVLDNLTYEWRLSSSPKNLGKAILINEAGKSFNFLSINPAVSGSQMVRLGNTDIVTSFIGEISPGVLRFGTSFTANNSQFGVLTQDVILPIEEPDESSSNYITEIVLVQLYNNLYRLDDGYVAINSSNLSVGDLAESVLRLSSSPGKPFNFKSQPAAVLAYDDGSFGVIYGSGSRWSEQLFLETGVSSGKAARLTISQVHGKELEFGLDINGGGIGDTVSEVIDANGYRDGANSWALYKNSSGNYVLDDAGKGVGQVLDSDSLMITIGRKSWSPKGMILGIAEKNSDELEILVRSGSSYTAHTVDTDNGSLVGRGIKLKGSSELHAREYYYDLDFNGDGEISLVGVYQPPSGWNL